MNLAQMLLGGGNDSALEQLGKNLGLDASSTRNVVSELVPSLSQGLRRNAVQGDGLSSLASALGSGNHQRYLDEPQRLGETDSIADGNSILGHLLGSKDVSRNVAAHAAQNSGVSADLIKKMLPMVATMAMGALSKQTGAGANLGSSGGGSDLLTSLLDSDGDGSVVDDVLNLAKKFF